MHVQTLMSVQMELPTTALKLIMKFARILMALTRASVFLGSIGVEMERVKV